MTRNIPIYKRHDRQGCQYISKQGTGTKCPVLKTTPESNYRFCIKCSGYDSTKRYIQQNINPDGSPYTGSKPNSPETDYNGNTTRTGVAIPIINPTPDKVTPSNINLSDIPINVDDSKDEQEKPSYVDVIPEPDDDNKDDAALRSLKAIVGISDEKIEDDVDDVDDTVEDSHYDPKDESVVFTQREYDDDVVDDNNTISEAVTEYDDEYVKAYVDDVVFDDEESQDTVQTSSSNTTSKATPSKSKGKKSKAKPPPEITPKTRLTAQTLAKKGYFTLISIAETQFPDDLEGLTDEVVKDQGINSSLEELADDMDWLQMVSEMGPAGALIASTALAIGFKVYQNRSKKRTPYRQTASYAEVKNVDPGKTEVRTNKDLDEINDEFDDL